MKKGKPSPLVLVDELLEYADELDRAARRAERAASQIAHAWANRSHFKEDERIGAGARRKYDWRLGLQLWIANMPAVEIGRLLGCGRKQIYAAAARYNWPARPDGRRHRVRVGDETL
jgi:hypothetical protein